MVEQLAEPVERRLDEPEAEVVAESVGRVAEQSLDEPVLDGLVAARHSQGAEVQDEENPDERGREQRPLARARRRRGATTRLAALGSPAATARLTADVPRGAGLGAAATACSLRPRMLRKNEAKAPWNAIAIRVRPSTPSRGSLTPSKNDDGGDREADRKRHRGEREPVLEPKAPPQPLELRALRRRGR